MGPSRITPMRWRSTRTWARPDVFFDATQCRVEPAQRWHREVPAGPQRSRKAKRRGRGERWRRIRRGRKAQYMKMPFSVGACVLYSPRSLVVRRSRRSCIDKCRLIKSWWRF
jgi:hypothetical protein